MIWSVPEIIANLSTYVELAPGDLIAAGYTSNFGKRRVARYVYLTAMLEAATWGAELARGEGRGRIYIVEPTGPFEDDPNLTDKKFPGNPTRSYRSRAPLRIVGEVASCEAARRDADEGRRPARHARASFVRRGV